MRRVRCRVCGERVRRDRIDAHMRAVHRPARRRPNALLAATVVAAIVMVAAFTYYITRPSPASEEEGGGPTDPNAVAVRFNSEDGWVLRGTFFRGDPSMPLVILVEGVDEDRNAWGPFLGELRGKGYNILAYDSRGQGESTTFNGHYKDWKSFSQADFQAGTRDIASAKYYALSTFQSAPRVGVVGASVGANQVLAFAASDSGTELKALVLLSPGNDYQGIPSAPAIDTLNARATRPAILFAAGLGEDSEGASHSLNQTYAGTRDLAIVSGGRHGTQLLTDPTFRIQVADFLASAFKD